MGSTTDFLEWTKKNAPDLYEKFLDRKTKYVKGKGGTIIEIENPDFIGPRKKAKGGMVEKKKKSKKAGRLAKRGYGAAKK
jgi:hypothetical protein